MVLPPVEVGGVKDTEAEPLPAVAVPMVGAPGAVAFSLRTALPVELLTVASVEENTPLIVWVPTASEDVVVDAVPDETVTGLPMGVEPSSNCTVPVTVEGVISAVSVSLVPTDCGLAGLTVTAVELVG